MEIRKIICFFAVLVLTSTSIPQDCRIITDVQAAPPVEKGAKGKGKSVKGNSDARSNGKGKSELHSGGEREKPDQRSKAFNKGKWDGDWDATDFLAAGFTSAALHEILGVNGDLLNTGATSLPPGIRMNLARGKALPPGIAKKRPGNQLAAALPRVAGHEWYEIGRDLVLISAGTYIVTQIMKDVLR